jgi:uncharacterized membrane protein YhaH (DUF805 family)
MGRARVDLSELFFSSSGRAGRLSSSIALAVLLGALALYQAAVDGALRPLTAWLVYAVLFFSAACVLSKRLHDRGRSGWWTALVLGAFLMIWPRIENPLDIVAILVLLWAFVEVVLLPSEPGANRYGPNPLRAVPV